MQLFSSEICEIFKTPTFKNICQRMLLYLHVILFTMHEKDLDEKIQLPMRD